MRRLADALFVLAVVALFSFARPAQAQSQTGVALAETLYQQARELMSAGRYDEACPKLEESYRLDPATGTLLNLASCHENQGKLASAWFEYLDAVTAARRDARPDRVEFAQGRLAELEPKLSRLTVVVVPEAADTPGLELELDRARIGLAARGVPTPVDPGTHVVEARAPGRKGFKVAVEIGTTPEQKTVTVPVLEMESALPPTPTPKHVEPGSPAPPPAKPAERPMPTSAYVSGAVTAALLVGAVVTGAMYIDRKGDYEATREKDAYDAAHTLGIVNAALWAGTAAGAGVTTYLYVTRPEEGASTATNAFPKTLPGLGVTLAGRF
ncbi:MAG TPA: hypothetical protein VF103_16065 [Polyangiaceae bacterium]